jgi:renalase
MSSVAIIGAGMSGLAAAHVLRDAGFTVTLFEKSRGVGGRTATRKRAGFIYDHGAQYIRIGGPDSIALITERFRAPDLLDISKPIWIFDGQGHIQEGDATQNAEPKWNYRSGITMLARLMALELRIHFETRIARLQKTSAGWQLFDSTNQDMGRFDLVLVTIPASQALELIQASLLQSDLRLQISSQLGQARYNPLLSVMLGYHSQLQTRPYYAIVNTDKAHAISWLAWEHEKAAERVPPGGGLLIAQMAPTYSQEHWEDAQEDLVRDVTEQTARLIAEPLAPADFNDIQRWRYALPAQKADVQALNTLTIPHALAFCGDAFVGGRVHLALENGIMVARQLQDF